MRLFAFALLTSVATAFAGPAPQIVFVGTVTRIDQAGVNPLKPFVVTTRIDRILHGTLSGKRFQFAVHSPSASGLELGHHYTVRADLSADGYIVDELQWRRR